MNIIIDRYKKVIIIFIVCLLLGGILGIIHNFSVEWDFVNHRFYLGYAYLNNRLDIDILPVMFRTCHFPFLDALNFFVITKSVNHPFVFLFLSGFKYGLFVFLSLLLFDLIIQKQNNYRKFLLFSAVYLSAFSFFVLLTKGYSYTDLQPACIILISLILYYKTLFDEFNLKKSIVLFISAFLIGIAVMLKYYLAVVGIGLIIFTLLFHKSVKSPFKTIAIMLIGMVSGFFVMGGHWFYVLYSHFQNPFYPYFNNIFPSSFSDSYDIFSIDFEHLRPKSVWEFIFAPFMNSIERFRGLEDGYYDLRLPLGFISIIIYAFIRFNKSFLQKIEAVVNIVLFDFTVCLTLFCFYSNLILFGNYRYIVYLFPLICLFIIILSYILSDSFPFKKAASFGVPFVILITVLAGFHSYSGEFYKTHIFHYISAALFFIFFVYLFIRENDNSRRLVYSFVSLAVIVPVMSVYFTLSDLAPLNKSDKTIYIENLGIEDGANVILGMVKTSVIAPFQNPKARYIGFAVPENFEDLGYIYSKNEYFQNKYLESSLYEIINEDKPLYFIQSRDYFGRDENISIYEEAIKYYSDNKDIWFDNCRYINNDILFNKYFKELYICKLK